MDFILDLLWTFIFMGIIIHLFAFFRTKYFNYLERKKRIRKWDSIWDKNNYDSSFEAYLISIYSKDRYTLKEEARSQYRGNIEFWRSYDNYLIILSDLKKLIIEDFKNNPDLSKLNSLHNRYSSELKFLYVLDSGSQVILDGQEVTYSTQGTIETYYIDFRYKLDLIKIFHEMTIKGFNGNNNHRSNTSKNSSHPKFKLYMSLKETVQKREEQLKKGEYSNGEESALRNELNNARNRMKSIKEKYNF